MAWHSTADSELTQPFLGSGSNLVSKGGTEEHRASSLHSGSIPFFLLSWDKYTCHHASEPEVFVMSKPTMDFIYIRLRKLLTLALTLLIFHDVPLLGIKMEGNGILENLEVMSLKVPRFPVAVDVKFIVVYILRQLQLKLTILFLKENSIPFTSNNK